MELTREEEHGGSIIIITGVIYRFEIILTVVKVAT